MTKDGGPAFPYGGIHVDGGRCEGMSLRDYALVAYHAALLSSGLPGFYESPKYAARIAAQHADAMLAERGK